MCAFLNISQLYVNEKGLLCNKVMVGTRELHIVDVVPQYLNNGNWLYRKPII